MHLFDLNLFITLLLFPSIKLSTQLLPSMFNDMQLLIQASGFFSFIMSKPSCSLSSYNICDILFHLWSSIPNLYSKMLPLVTAGYSFSGSFHRQLLSSSSCSVKHISYMAIFHCQWSFGFPHECSIDVIQISIARFECRFTEFHPSSFIRVNIASLAPPSLHNMSSKITELCSAPGVSYSSRCQWSGKDILIFLPFKL